MSQDKHPIRDKVVAALIVAVLLPVVEYFTGYLSTAWLWSKSAFAYVYSAVMDVTTISIALPLWLLPLLVILPYPMFRWIVHLGKPKGPNWRGYTTDQFHDMIWRWRYGKYNTIIGCWCYCPSDDTQLVSSYDLLVNEVILRCETCQARFGPFDGDHNHMVSMIHRQIERKHRSGEWQQVVACDRETVKQDQ